MVKISYKTAQQLKIIKAFFLKKVAVFIMETLGVKNILSVHINFTLVINIS